MMSQNLSPLLVLYMGRRFMAHFMVIFSVLASVIFLLEAVEMIRRLAKYGNATPWRVLSMTALKLPETILDLMPFAILIAAVFTFWRLTRTSELVAIRATGVSAWQFLFAPVLLAALIGGLKMSVFNPVSATLIAHYEQQEERYITRSNSMVNIASTGLWLRQYMKDDQIAIIHAQTVTMPEGRFKPVTAFFFDKNNILTHRIDSSSAELKKGEWVFHDAWSNNIKEDTVNNFYSSLRLPTDISMQDIQSRFSSPNAIPFWNLPEYAKIMQDTGFEANSLWAHFYDLLAEPLLNCALVLLAAALALRAPRQQRSWWLVAGTVLTGFIVFFMGDFLQALGISERLPIVLAAFAPATISLLMGLTALLYLEDG